MSPVLLFSLMGAGLLLLGGLLFMIIQSTAPPDVSVQLASVKQRLVTLSAVTTEQGKKITQSELSSINSTLGTLLTSMDSGVTEYMKAHSGKTAATSTTQSATEKAYRDKLSQKLNDAYLTGTLDRIYASEMTYQLGILKSKLQSIKAAANNKTFNELYATNIKSLDTVSSTLSKFQSTK